MTYEDSPRAAWVRELITETRARVGSIPPDERSLVSLLPLAYQPCQVLAFYLTWRKSLRLYALHLSEVADLTVWAYTAQNEGELVRLLDRIEKDPPFREEVPEGQPFRPSPPSSPTYSSLLQTQWEEWLEELRGTAYHEPSGSGSGFTWGGMAIQKFDFSGDDAQKSPVDTLLRQVEWAKESASRFGELAPSRSTPRTREEIDEAIARQQVAFVAATDWLGTYAAPPVRVGPAPERSLEERMRQRTAPDVADFGRVVATGRIQGKDVICTDFGFIGIRSRDRGEVAASLNLFFGALYLGSYRCHRVLPSDLCQFQYDSANTRFGNSSVPPSDRVLHNKLPRSHRLYRLPQYVPLDAVRNSIHEAELMRADARLPALLPLILDSRLMIDSKDWDHGFFSAWLTIERQVTAEIDDEIRTGSVTTASLVGLRSSGNPLLASIETDPSRVRESVAYSINVLFGLGALPSTDWQDIDKLRKVRRRILHPSSKATEAEAKECLKVATRIVEQRASRVLGRMVTTPVL